MSTTESVEAAPRRRSPYSPGIDPQKLKYIRFVRKQWSQARLADEVAAVHPGGHMSRAWVAKLESGRGKPSVDVLAALCEALDVKPQDLLPDEVLRQFERKAG
jgi:transcriptional regulator with XRE-family HTH domain